jgi:inosine-uridine nucleoside N-ribohydrolase
MTERIPILLDTDIGSDIDDAVCLAYLLRQPRCELLGITTVTGEPTKRAMLADAVCRAAGREDVPIHSGVETPLLVPLLQTDAPQVAALARFPHRTDFAPNTAVEFLRQTIRARPGEITLLAIGPLTNIGLLFAVDPEIPRLLKGLMLMCGLFDPHTSYGTLREWNALGDPHATAIVYKAPVASHRSVGLDVTTRCVLDAETCRQRLRGGPLDVVASMAEVWFKHSGAITFHDPLAAAAIFHPELCEWKGGTVEVELCNPRLAGLTMLDPHTEAKPHDVAWTVDAKAFFSEYFEVVG